MHKKTFLLLAFPITLIGVIQLIFALLSLLVFRDKQTLLFFLPSVFILCLSSVLLYFNKKSPKQKIQHRDALLFSCASWVLLGLLGAIPIALITHISMTDAVFESVSALTTTGATVLTHLDQMPHSFLLYRQFLQWLGGLGVVVFVVAILPMLNVGGMKLLKSETPGPIKDEKLSPRIANTAHQLWILYIIITVFCALSYYAVGLSGFDAIAHSFSTVSTGGFSTHDASMEFFHNPAALIVTNIFMILGATSFALHFKVWKRKNLYMYLHNEELRTFLYIIAALSLFISAVLIIGATHHSVWHAINNALFHVISFITSTGYSADNISTWPNITAIILVLSGFLGGCAGSTAGGNKIIRNILSYKILSQELKQIIYPNGVFFITYQDKKVEPAILRTTMAFMFTSMLCTLFLTLVIMATGLDFWSSFTAVSACINVLGPAFGELASNFQAVSDAGTWVLSGTMILGRLEYFTVLVLLLPTFWQQ